MSNASDPRPLGADTLNDPGRSGRSPASVPAGSPLVVVEQHPQDGGVVVEVTLNRPAAMNACLLYTSKEQAELSVIETFLPKALGADELLAIVKTVVTDVGACLLYTSRCV